MFGLGKKIDLYLDADDTILDSSEAVIEILNKRYNIQPQKTYADMFDWGYKSVYNDLAQGEIEDIYSSDDFFASVKLDPVFEKFYLKNKHNFNFYIVTKGTEKNLELKKELFSILIPNAKFIGLIFQSDPDLKHTYSKQSIDMSNGIQIDDRIDCLQTNAALKILYTHNREFSWNNTSRCHIENRYDCGTWEEITKILEFFVKNKKMVGAD